jgi:pimeloyl-ACP methyl ester carboxylesterase
VHSLLLTLLVVAAGVTLWRSTTREAATEADYPPEGRIVMVEGVRMHVVERGPADGSVPDLVMIHGASGSVRDLTFGLIDDLAQRYRVIAIDRPGLGWSDAAPGTETLAAQARLIRGAAAAAGTTRPLVFGHSYGGAVALAWALDAPETVAALALAAPVSHPWEGDIPALYKVTGHPLAGPAAVTAISAWVPEAYVVAQTNDVFLPDPAPPGYDDHFGPMMSARASALRANAEQRLVLKDQVRLQSDRYPGLTLPVEIVHGDADMIVGLAIHSERLAAEVAGARLTVLPGAGHMPHHTARPAVIAAIDRAATRAGFLSGGSAGP